MAKRRKAPPARKSRVARMEEHSLLLRSAESLGRVIGTLQRQLNDASRRLGTHKAKGNEDAGASGSGAKKSRTKKAKKKAAARPAARQRKRTTH